MRKIMWVFIALLFCMFIYPNGSGAVTYPITTLDFSTSGGTSAIFEPADFTFSVDFGQFSDNPPDDIHFNVFTALGTDAGNTYVLDSGPVFAAAVEFLTDGENEYIQNSLLMGGGGSKHTASEAIHFYEDNSGATGIDFAGYRINSLTLDFVSFTSDVPGEDPNGDGIWTSYSMTAYMHIDAVKVPEPSTLLLLCGGFLGMAVIRRKGQDKDIA